MKKVVLVMIFAFVAAFSVNICYATDVWFHTEIDRNGYKTEYYLMTQYIKENYQKGTFDVGIKSVFYQNGTMTGRPYQFAYLNGEWYFTQTNSSSGYENVKYFDIFLKAFNACKPYVRLAREYPIY